MGTNKKAKKAASHRMLIQSPLEVMHAKLGIDKFMIQTEGRARHRRMFYPYAAKSSIELSVLDNEISNSDTSPEVAVIGSAGRCILDLAFQALSKYGWVPDDRNRETVLVRVFPEFKGAPPVRAMLASVPNEGSDAAWVLKAFCREGSELCREPIPIDDIESADELEMVVSRFVSKVNAFSASELMAHMEPRAINFDQKEKERRRVDYNTFTGKLNFARLWNGILETKDLGHAIDGYRLVMGIKNVPDWACEKHLEIFLKKIGDQIGMGYLPAATKVIQIFSDEAIETLSRLIGSGGHPGTQAGGYMAYATKLREDLINLDLATKPVASISAETALKIENLIADKFPNFLELSAYLKGQFALARLGDGNFCLPPILLVGEPGIGKTELLLQITELLGADFLSIDMASAQTNSVLVGTDSYYANAKPGALLNKLVYGKTANPIVFLDEIDKTGGDDRYDPSSALYSLLEKRTARKFADQSLPGVEMDASHIVWFAAANNELKIDGPILSRFKVFRIPSPDSSNIQKIILSVYFSLLDQESWGQAFPRELPDLVIDCLRSTSPRAMKMVLTNACANAAIAGRRELLPEDIETAKERRAGF